ncbi:MAG TPA: hypothetical protein VGQ76_07230 [Thermoanaerobaculia bacterium]|jgi:hypothetical protein|nr:hypothetical protein [Thermoanaerobaculia bacterium]
MHSSLLKAALPLMLVVTIVALHSVWTIGADKSRAKQPDKTERVLRDAIEASPVFAKPLVITLPKRVPDQLRVTDDYPAIEAMSQWITRTSDSSSGQDELVLALTPIGRAELYPYLEETDTEYRIAIARRAVWLITPDPDQQHIRINYEWKPLNALGRSLPPHNQFRETGKYTFHGSATFRRAPDSWVLVEMNVEPDVYFMIEDRLVAPK